MTADVIDSPRLRFNVTYTTTLPTDPTATTTPDPPTTTEDPATPHSSTSPLTTGPTMPTTPGPEMLHTLFLAGTWEYVTVLGNILTTNYTSETFFTLIPVTGGENQFHLFYDGETFVAPRTRAPFEFFLQSQFPAEPPAVFSLEPYKFYLNSSYGGG